MHLYTTGGVFKNLESIMPTFGERLRELRLARGWDLFETSRRSGIALATLSGYENGRAPTVTNLMKLARALEISLGVFDAVEPPADGRHRMRPVLQAIS
jgi:transcriptional regulator with XRE-family HTH domain